jgi:hypothetical protein
MDQAVAKFKDYLNDGTGSEYAKHYISDLLIFQFALVKPGKYSQIVMNCPSPKP